MSYPPKPPILSELNVKSVAPSTGYISFEVVFIPSTAIGVFAQTPLILLTT